MTTAVYKMILAFRPIPDAVAEEARRMRQDAFGHDLKIQTGETSPCRVCLRITEPADEVLLLSYRPLDDDTPYAEIGPIFIHADRCPRYDSVNVFPPAFLKRELVLRAYDYEGRISDAKVVPPGEAERVATDFLARPDVREVHVRHTSYTCFDFKIERAQGS